MATTAPPAAADSAPNTWKPELHDLAVDAIATSGNVRAQVGDIVSLIDSVKAHGVISPIRVADIGAGQYELIYGQRRLAAAKAAGLKTIPAIVDAEQPAREDRAVDQLVENLQRTDLNALDTATAYRWLLDKGLTQRQLGERLGVSQPTIANTLALLKQPEAIQQRVASGELTRSHAEALGKLPETEREEVARRIAKHKLSTRQVEEEIALAERRQVEADAARDLVAKVIPAVAAKVPGILKQEKLDSKAITLIVPTQALHERLLADGFTVAETPKKEPDALYGGLKDPCLETVRLVRWYATWGADYPPQVEKVCVDPSHKAGREEARKKQIAAEERKWAKVREEQAVAREAERIAAVGEAEKVARTVAVALAAADKLEVCRIVLAAAIGEDQRLFDYLVERRVPEADQEGLGVVDDPVWAVVSELTDADLLTEIGLLVVDNVGDQVRQHIDALAKPTKAAKA